MLYAETGATMPEDCYEIKGWPRPLVKTALLTLIDAPTQDKARGPIAFDDAMSELALPGSQQSFRLADRLMADIRRVHAPISDFFHCGTGAMLMASDAKMSEAIMMRMYFGHGVVVLPVHDSYLVPESKADALENTMLEVAHEFS